jgi:plasmid replication initiation protein
MSITSSIAARHRLRHVIDCGTPSITGGRPRLRARVAAIVFASDPMRRNS